MMKTDRRLRRLPQIQIPERFFEKKKIKTESVYVKEYGGVTIEYADYLEEPLPLIADRFHSLLQKYQPDMAFYQVVLIEQKTGEQRPYQLISPPEIECMCEEVQKKGKCEMYECILDENKIGKNKIFLAKDLHKQLIVRLDVAESILRREANGIWFEPVKIQGRRN